MAAVSVAAVSQIAIKDWVLILGLIFGGCCSNVFTLEKIVLANPNSGNVITFFQFLFIAIEGYIHFFDSSRPPFYVKKNQVPMKKWSLTVIMFFLLSLANNLAFGFNISMPIHIIFRSSGTAIVMTIGWLLAGKKYNVIQVLSAILLTIGAIITTIYKDKELFVVLSKRDDDGGIIDQITSQNWLDILGDDVMFFIGIGVLTFGAILMALLGLYNEHVYKTYGKHWQENVFYSHLCGLPIFITFLSPKIIAEFKDLWNDPETISFFGQFTISKQSIYLLMNVLTQFFCIRGVNMLAGSTTALTVSVVLLLRKFSSLLLSLYLFDNSLSYTGSFGAAMVFFGAFLYSYGSTRGSKAAPPQVTEDQKEELRPEEEEVELQDVKKEVV